MRLELAVAKRERDFYLQKVEQAKQIEKMEELLSSCIRNCDGA